MVQQWEKTVPTSPLCSVPGEGPQIRRLWKNADKDCGWKLPRAPMARLLWKEKAVEAVLEFLRDTRVGCRSTVMARIGPPVEEKRDVGGDEEGGPGPP